MEKIYIKENSKCSNVDKYLKPEYIYIPINDNKYIEKDYIYKNELITDNIYSPISGYVRDDTYKYINNKKTKCMVIENDYKEKNRSNKYVFNKDNFINTLINNNLIDNYDEYNIKYLVINAIDIEPYIYSKKFYINNYTSEILGIIDSIMTKLNISKSVIAVTSDELYNNLFNYIGTYPNIKIIEVDDYYPVGNNRVLFKELFGYTYNKTSLERKVWILDILSLIDVDSIIKNNIPKNEKIITIGGTSIKNSVIRVKIGTSVREIIKYLGGYKANDISITMGGPLTGKFIDSDDTIITKDTTSIFMTKDKSIKEKECILCGRCNSVCPINLVPVFIMKNINKEKILNKLNINKCIECGLCSYICPAYINLKDYIIKAKGVINNE